MILRLMTSGLVKFVISCVILYTMITNMMSGELTTFWFLMYTLALAILLASHKNIRKEKDGH